MWCAGTVAWGACVSGGAVMATFKLCIPVRNVAMARSRHGVSPSLLAMAPRLIGAVLSLF